MPPVLFVGVANAPYTAQNASSNLAEFELVVPADAREGDTLVAVLAVSGGQVDFANLDGAPLAKSSWSVVDIFDISSGTYMLFVLRHECTDDEPASYLLEALEAGGLRGHGAVLAYRGLAPAAAVDANIAEVVASTNFACPGVTLAAYSDLFIGVAFASGSQPTFTPPAGGVERFDSAGFPTRALSIFDYRHDAAGALAAQVAIASLAASGFAASIVLAANATPGLDKALQMTVPGAIGLLSEGA
jgi:hypothetical protein